MEKLNRRLRREKAKNRVKDELRQHIEQVFDERIVTIHGLIEKMIIEKLKIIFDNAGEVVEVKDAIE